jgi:hypothetical protein
MYARRHEYSIRAAQNLGAPRKAETMSIYWGSDEPYPIPAWYAEVIDTRLTEAGVEPSDSLALSVRMLFAASYQQVVAHEQRLLSRAMDEVLDDMRSEVEPLSARQELFKTSLDPQADWFVEARQKFCDRYPNLWPICIPD